MLLDKPRAVEVHSHQVFYRTTIIGYVEVDGKINAVTEGGDYIDLSYHSLTDPKEDIANAPHG